MLYLPRRWGNSQIDLMFRIDEHSAVGFLVELITTANLYDVNVFNVSEASLDKQFQRYLRSQV